VIGVDLSPERVAAAEQLGCDRALIADDDVLDGIMCSWAGVGRAFRFTVVAEPPR